MVLFESVLCCLLQLQLLLALQKHGGGLWLSSDLLRPYETRASIKAQVTHVLWSRLQHHRWWLQEG